MATMKAANIRRYGGLECIDVGDVAAPDGRAGEVTIDVHAAALNHLDIWVRMGRPGPGLPMPHVLGSDAAGTVGEIGGGVTGLAKGDRVVLNPGLFCGACEFCRRGEQSECASYSIIGMGRWGTFAERVAVPAECVFPAPAHLTWEEAAALPLAYLTAWRMLMTRGRLQPGETVLIHGIGGGVALAGLQLAKLVQAHVVVTSSSEEKLGRAKALGADDGINYRDTPDVAKAILQITRGRGVDLALDTTGGATWGINFAGVRRGGRIVHCGVTTGKTAEVDISALYWNHLSVHGSTMGSQDDFRAMLAAVSASKLKPVVDSVHPLERIREATARMERGEQFGKIVLRVRD
jgi:NADPH:quinone reductase-like Zn-dependent oxidoreductase